MRPPGILILPAKGRLGYNLPIRSNCNSPLACISWMFEMRFHSQIPYQTKRHTATVLALRRGAWEPSSKAREIRGEALCRVPECHLD